MLKRGDKKGQELSTNVIILIILGVVVLVVLILGFTVGWGKIAPWLSSENVDSVVNQCSVACSTQSVYDYCTKERTLNDGEKEIKDLPCWELSHYSDFEKYGIASCSSIDCKRSCGEIGGSWVNACSTIKVSGPFTDGPKKNEICCILPE